MKIEISGLKQPVCIGVGSAERSSAQLIEIDLGAWLSEKQMCLSDEVNHTVDYTKLIHAISVFSSESSWKLLEKYCFDLAQELLSGFQIIESVSIRAKKRILPGIEYFACSLELKREA